MTSTPAPSRPDLVAAETVEAACKAYWPLHWPHQFAPADLASIREHMRRAVVAALASEPEPQPVAEWQDIASAPKDGKDYPCLTPEYDGPVMLSWWKLNGKYAWRDWDHDTYNPTHWLPYPASPHLAEEKKT